jgi:hypothetical protein
MVLSGLVLGLGLITPAVALGAVPGDISLHGKSKGVAAVDVAFNPAPTTVFARGRLAHLGAFIAIDSDSFTPNGPGPTVIPYTVTGNETMVMANGDQIFGTVAGTGVNDSGATRGTDVVTITGGTGAFAFATGSYTVTYTGRVLSQVATSLVGPINATVRGFVHPGGYVDPLAGHQRRQRAFRAHRR